MARSSVLLAAALLCAAAVAAAGAGQQQRLLVLADDPAAIKTSHSKFLASLKQRGYRGNVKAIGSKTLQLKEWDDWLYDKLVIFGGSKGERPDRAMAARCACGAAGGGGAAACAPCACTCSASRWEQPAITLLAVSHDTAACVAGSVHRAAAPVRRLFIRLLHLLHALHCTLCSAGWRGGCGAAG